MLSALEMRSNYLDLWAGVDRRMRVGVEAVEGTRKFAERLNDLGLQASKSQRKRHYDHLKEEVAKGEVTRRLVDVLA